MKLKLDENMPVDVIALLIDAGHEVDTVEQEGLKGANDTQVLEASTADERILLRSTWASGIFENTALVPIRGLSYFGSEISGGRR